MTALEAIKRALRLCAVITSGEASSAAEAQDALSTLNSMLHGWKDDGIKLEHIDFTLTSVFPWPQNHDEPIINNLAAMVAPEYGVPLNQVVLTVASKGYRNLQNYYVDPQDAVIDDALNPYYSPNRFGT